jgi:hypothetical protein
MEFLDALRRFKSFLTAQQLTGFKTVSSDTLRVALLRIQSDQAARLQSMNLTRIQPFVEGFRQLEQGLGFAETPDFIAYILGAVKFSLQVSRPRLCL